MVTLRKKGADSVHSHNVSASLLIQAGLEELVADTEDDYLRIALELAGVRLSLSRARARALSLSLSVFVLAHARLLAYSRSHNVMTVTEQRSL